MHGVGAAPVACRASASARRARSRRRGWRARERKNEPWPQSCWMMNSRVSSPASGSASSAGEPVAHLQAAQRQVPAAGEEQRGGDELEERLAEVGSLVGSDDLVPTRGAGRRGRHGSPARGPWSCSGICVSWQPEPMRSAGEAAPESACVVWLRTAVKGVSPRSAKGQGFVIGAARPHWARRAKSSATAGQSCSCAGSKSAPLGQAIVWLSASSLTWRNTCGSASGAVDFLRPALKRNRSSGSFRPQRRAEG